MLRRKSCNLGMFNAIFASTDDQMEACKMTELIQIAKDPMYMQILASFPILRLTCIKGRNPFSDQSMAY
jgi:hypothetical protein